MSSFLCVCDNRISDFLYPSPTHGYLVGQEEHEIAENEFVAMVRDFLQALGSGHRKKWIRSCMGPTYPLHTEDALVISDILSHCRRRRRVAECDVCGRLYVQTDSESNEYRSYAPDTPGYHHLLDHTMKPDDA